MSKGISTILIIILLAVFLLASAGVYFWQATRLPVSEPLVPALTPVPAPAPTPPPPDPTADWKTYRNEQYGFEFRYPPLPSWRIDDSKMSAFGMLSLISADKVSIDFSVGGERPVSEKNRGVMDIKNKSTFVTGDGVPVLRERVIETACPAFRYIFFSPRETDTKLYVFTYVYDPDIDSDGKGCAEWNNNLYNRQGIHHINSEDLNYQRNLDQILSTFRFIK